MTDKNRRERQEEVDEQLFNMRRYGTTMNQEDASYKASDDIEYESNLEYENTSERHNENARASAALESEYPRINTDNL